ncbi:hypothetical protein BV898_15751 [Hypsibius exemplaris]|uniref:Uncharacterized protein n=1 Tax=Hypsibius exemplaris TaxID=2072580 RepID=A0A9X6RKM8_HYPEX|nr:hypothetical protein BV898_15751 [Hypsibius exemplaris]
MVMPGVAGRIPSPRARKQHQPGDKLELPDGDAAAASSASARGHGRQHKQIRRALQPPPRAWTRPGKGILKITHQVPQPDRKQSRLHQYRFLPMKATEYTELNAVLPEEKNCPAYDSLFWAMSDAMRCPIDDYWPDVPAACTHYRNDAMTDAQWLRDRVSEYLISHPDEVRSTGKHYLQARDKLQKQGIKDPGHRVTELGAWLDRLKELKRPDYQPGRDELQVLAIILESPIYVHDPGEGRIDYYRPTPEFEDWGWEQQIHLMATSDGRYRYLYKVVRGITRDGTTIIKRRLVHYMEPTGDTSGGIGSLSGMNPAQDIHPCQRRSFDPDEHYGAWTGRVTPDGDDATATWPYWRGGTTVRDYESVSRLKWGEHVLAQDSTDRDVIHVRTLPIIDLNAQQEAPCASAETATESDPDDADGDSMRNYRAGLAEDFLEICGVGDVSGKTHYPSFPELSDSDTSPDESEDQPKQDTESDSESSGSDEPIKIEECENMEQTWMAAIDRLLSSWECDAPVMEPRPATPAYGLMERGSDHQ